MHGMTTLQALIKTNIIYSQSVFGETEAHYNSHSGANRSQLL